MDYQAQFQIKVAWHVEFTWQFSALVQMGSLGTEGKSVSDTLQYSTDLKCNEWITLSAPQSLLPNIEKKET